MVVCGFAWASSVLRKLGQAGADLPGAKEDDAPPRRSRTKIARCEV
jgi:hypothetical protein